MSNDLIACWAYPLVPDPRLFDSLSDCRALKQNKANKKKNLRRIPAGVVLGEGVSVSPSANLSHCVVGKNTLLGNNCQVNHCHIWNGECFLVIVHCIL